MQSKNDYRLLPCPFCGSTRLDPPERGIHYVRCMDCDAYGPSPEGCSHAASAAASVEAWNRRRTTLRDDLVELADSWQEFAINSHYIKSLRALIAKHWPTQEPTK